MFNVPNSNLIMICVGSAVVLVLFFTKKLLKMVKFFVKIIAKTFVGCLILFGINLIGSTTGVTTYLNPLSGFLVGTLGLSGMILVIAIKYLKII